MKKIVSMFMVIVMALTLSMTAFAAEREASEASALRDKLSDSGDCISVERIDDLIETRGVAPEVSSVEIIDFGFIKEDAYPQRAGHFAVIVKMMGYGYKYAYFDGKSIGLPLETEGILNANNVAVGWYLLYDCGELTPGQHKFEIKVQSYQTATHQKTAFLEFSYDPK